MARAKLTLGATVSWRGYSGDWKRSEIDRQVIVNRAGKRISKLTTHEVEVDVDTLGGLKAMANDLPDDHPQAFRVEVIEELTNATGDFRTRQQGSLQDVYTGEAAV